MKIKDSELIITDKHGVSMVLNKFKVTDGMGKVREMLELYPLNVENQDDRDNFSIIMPIEEFDSMIAFIKDRYLIDGKEVDVNELIRTNK